MPELRISTDKVCALIELSREIAGRVDAVSARIDDAAATDDDTGGDDSALQSLEVVDDDPRPQEIRDIIDELNVEERIDLLALLYVGGGDFALDEWSEARREASDRLDLGEADFLIGDMAMPDHLAAGLDAFGKSCDE